jgi:hypothetical protein
MTCYFRRLQWIFRKAGIEVTSENKSEIDEIIHSMVGVKYKNCRDTWREVKEPIANGEAGFVLELKKTWKVSKGFQ